MSKDVKEIHHIPNIENYAHCVFLFDGFDVGDRTAFYQCDLWDDGVSLYVEIISDEMFIEHSLLLHDLLYASNVFYLRFQIRGIHTDVVLDSWEYRPFIPETDKDYD